MKVVAFNGSPRQHGNTEHLIKMVFEELEKENILISQMMVVGSSYWNMGIGLKPGDVEQDEEGVRTMKNLGKNMAAELKRRRSDS